MRKLPYLIALLMLSLMLLAAAASAHAAATPVLGSAALAAAGEPEADESDEGEGEEAEACEAEEESEEEGESCEAEGEAEEDEGECVLESASANVAANTGNGRVRVTVHYTTSTPSTVNLDYSLTGGKGGLHLGSARARFHRSGVFHDAVSVGGGKLAKLAAARQFVVEVQAAGDPSFCRERLTVQAPHRASRRHRAGGRGRSGGPARTRGS